MSTPDDVIVTMAAWRVGLWPQRPPVTIPQYLHADLRAVRVIRGTATMVKKRRLEGMALVELADGHVEAIMVTLVHGWTGWRLMEASLLSERARRRVPQEVAA